MGGNNAVHDEISIRMATPKDAPAMAHISILGWRFSYGHILPAEILDNLDEEKRAENMRERIEAMDGVVSFALVATDPSGRILGFVECGPQTSTVEGIDSELQTFYVHPDVHGRGIGKRLMVEAVKRLIASGRNSMIVWTFADNAATGFYERLGGKLAKTSTYVVGGVSYPDVGFAWTDLAAWLKSRTD